MPRPVENPSRPTPLAKVRTIPHAEKHVWSRPANSLSLRSRGPLPTSFGMYLARPRLGPINGLWTAITLVRDTGIRPESHRQPMTTRRPPAIGAGVGDGMAGAQLIAGDGAEPENTGPSLHLRSSSPSASSKRPSSSASPLWRSLSSPHPVNGLARPSSAERASNTADAGSGRGRCELQQTGAFECTDVHRTGRQGPEGALRILRLLLRSI